MEIRFILLFLLFFPLIYLNSFAEIKEKEIKDMVYIPAGEFTMGRAFKLNYWVPNMYNPRSEEPAHKVFVDAFYIDKYEITNEDYKRFISATSRHAPPSLSDSNFNEPKQPVVTVTWEDAVAYCIWVEKRLPTEDEWEKAARGNDGRKYPWGNQWDPMRANYGFNDDGRWAKEPEYRKPSRVGSYPLGASPYGVMDMCGNVWEWTSSLIHTMQKTGERIQRFWGSAWSEAAPMTVWAASL